MKLVRFGAPGREKPGIIDDKGRIRDLSKVVPDIAGETLSPKGLNKIRKTDLSKLPTVKAGTRLGPCVGDTRHFIAIGLNYADHAAETGAQIPKEPIIFQKAPTSIVGPNDDTMIPKGSTKLDYECRDRDRDRRARALPLEEERARRGRRLLHLQRRLGAQLPGRARRPVDQGQGLRNVRPARAVARHQGRDRERAEARHVARRERREAPARQHQDHDLRHRAHRLVLLAVLRAWSRAT